MRCPHCDNKLVQTSGDVTRVRIQGKLEFGADGVAKSRCFWCDKPVDIPALRLVSNGATIPREKFTVSPRS